MSLKAAISRFNDKVEGLVESEFRARVVSIANDAIANTPVDTGRLRGNWLVGFGYEPDGTPFGGGPEDVASMSALNRVAEAANARNKSGFAYITNNMTYAVAVEKGGPTNRPRRMLARAILRASKQL